MKRFWTTMATAVLAAGVAQAGETATDQVSYDENGAVSESLTGVAGDPQMGAEIMVDKGKGNCVACHSVTALEHAPFHGDVGPSLDGVGSRWGTSELRGLVSNAKMTFDGTVMPAFYKNSGFIRPGDEYTGDPAPADLKPILTAQEVEDVVAFLSTLKDE